MNLTVKDVYTPTYHDEEPTMPTTHSQADYCMLKMLDIDMEHSFSHNTQSS